jgi:hypothetical protein
VELVKAASATLEVLRDSSAAIPSASQRGAAVLLFAALRVVCAVSAEFESGYIELSAEKLEALKLALAEVARRQIDDALAVAIRVA